MNILTYILIGAIVGTISGALGIGGGILLVPALIWICRFDYSTAAGTSLAILVPPVGLLAALEAYSKGRVRLDAAVCIACAFALGAYLGAVLEPRVPQATIRLFFGLLMMFIAIRFIFSADTSATPALMGLIAMLVSWFAYLGLTALGRRYLPPPKPLSDQIRNAAERTHDGTDYYI